MKRMDASELPISGRWLHSFEEDSGDTRVYRPADSELPRARGRAGIEFLPDGTFIDRQIGPTDAPQEVRGRWEYVGAGVVRLSFADANQQDRTVEIVQCDEQKLCLRQGS